MFTYSMNPFLINKGVCEVGELKVQQEVITFTKSLLRLYCRQLVRQYLGHFGVEPWSDLSVFSVMKCGLASVRAQDEHAVVTCQACLALLRPGLETLFVRRRVLFIFSSFLRR